MTKGVAITGMGIISSIGNNVAENHAALTASRHGMSTIELISTRHKEVIKVGEIKTTNEVFFGQLGLSLNNNYARTTLLGMVAAQEAVAQAGISDLTSHRNGLISATSVGGMDQTEKYYYDYLDSDLHRRYIEGHPAGESSQKIAAHLGISDYVTTISTACSSSANAIMLGARLIRAGMLDRVVVGGADSLSKFTINGFKTLMILSDDHCTPFDADRKGLNLGEGAAYLVMESEALVQQYGKPVLARLAGYGNANDAFHQTASSDEGEGATLAMQKAFEVAGIAPAQIDYINAHGTATPNNDLSEGRAIHRVFGESPPPVSSTKAFTGHTLAAAGAIEAVFSILALEHQVVFPNLNYSSPIPEIDIIPITEVRRQEVRYVLSNSFGFGGNCSSLLFSKTRS